MFADPENNVLRFGISEGMRVADFGSGSGAYALALAKRVGGSGRVYAVDIRKDMLDRLDKEARSRSLRNLHVLRGDLERVGGSRLKDGCCDLVLISNLLFQVDGKYTLALEAKRVLGPGSRALVIDWADSFSNLGPPADQVVTPEQVKEIFTRAGFVFSGEFPAGDHHYGLIFTKPNPLKTGI